jgi:radical SAM protein with 4Fe4S-binding SPASM domain
VAKTVLMTLNKNDVVKIKNMTSSIGMISTFDLSITNAENNARDPRKYALSQKEIYELFKNKDVANILLSSKPVEEELCGLEDKFKPDDSRCNIGRGTMWIDSKGYVYPCLVYPDPIGYLKESSLHYIWYEGSEIGEILELSKYKNYKACHTCDAKNYCSPCIAMSKLEEKNNSCNSASYTRAFASKQLVDEIKKQDNS